MFLVNFIRNLLSYLDRVKRIWYLSPMRAAKVQASLRIRAVSPEPSLLDHTSSESRGTFIQKARSLAPLNGWACAVKICHDGMLKDTNSLDGAHLLLKFYFLVTYFYFCYYHYHYFCWYILKFGFFGISGHENFWLLWTLLKHPFKVKSQKW